MTTEAVHLLGAGGHGRVLIDALICCGWSAHAIRVRDDRAALQGTVMLGCRIETPMKSAQTLSGWVHAAVGSGVLRENLLVASGLDKSHWLTVVHPRAVVAASALVGAGSFVAAQAVVGPCARLGDGVIVNHGAVVDHDCEVSDFCHIAPMASLSGGVKVGRGVLIGTGARLLPGVQVGDGAVIGAGAVVLKNVPAAQTWVGVPAVRDSES